MRYRASVAYDGTAYQGFQRQIGDTPTVQLALEKAIARVTQVAVTVLAAGRTDTGVHAADQVIAFDVATWRHGDEALLRAINAVLPDDIALQDLTPAPAAFHPRFDALSRVYRYQVVQSPQRQPLLRQRAWYIRQPLDGGLMQRSADQLVGTHDFATFGQPPQGESTVRMVYQSVWTQVSEPGRIVWWYTIEANAFLQHMVRRVVWLLVEVGRGHSTPDDFEALFHRARLADSRLAPPQGLTLEQVRYPPATLNLPSGGDAGKMKLDQWTDAGETPAGGSNRGTTEDIRHQTA
jgi:tRNA pseudouridine38-40 synthase